MVKPSIVLAHVVLLSASIYFLFNYAINTGLTNWKQLPYLAVGPCPFLGALGFLMELKGWTQDENQWQPSYYTMLYNCLEVWMISFTFPCLNTEYFVKYKVHERLNYFPLVIGGLITFVGLLSGHVENDLSSLSVYLNSLSLAALGQIYNNDYATSAAVVFGFGYYIYRNGIVYCGLTPSIIFFLMFSVFLILACFGLESI